MAKRILLADDSVTAQNMGRKILSDAGYEVVTVNNGSAALKKITEQTPEIIILDVYMPGYSGLEVCQRLKEAPDTSPIPVLLTVGKLEPFKAEEAKRVHADSFIIKPFEATELLTVLSKLEDKIAPQPAPKASPAKSSQTKAAQEKPEKAQGRHGRGGSINDRAVPAAPTPPVVVRNPPKTKEPSEAEAEWKNRLRIPGPPATAFHDLRIPRAASSAGAAEPEAFEIALPPGITSEEIAAISEAASLISAEGQETEGEAETAQSEVTASTEPAEFPTTFAAVPAEPEATVETPVAAPSVELAAPPAEEYHPAPAAPAAAEATAAEAAHEAPATEAFVPEATEEREAAVESHAVPEAPAAYEPAPVHDDHLAEIEVALASLAPVENVQFEGVVSAEAHRAAFASQGVEVYPRGHGSLVEELYGARWIAEEVPVDETTCALSLDREMQQVYEMSRANGHSETAVAEAEIEAASSMGAFQAIEESLAAAGTDAFVIQEAHPFESEAAAVVVEEPSDEEAAAVAASGFVGDADSSNHESFAVEPAAMEPVAVEPAEAEPVSEAELPVQAESEPEPIAENQASQQPEADWQVEPAVETAADAEAPVQHDASIEAAAVSEHQPSAHHEPVETPAASTDLSPSHEVEPSPEDVPSEAAEAETGDAVTSDSSTFHDFPSPRGDDDEQPPDVAAAWARWRQIRDSLTSPEFTEQLADAAAGEVLAAQAHHDNGAGGDLGAHFKDIRQNEPAPPQPEPAPQAAAAAAAAGSADSAAISSIVESVLAELKPKLVEEIAKKLGKK